MSESALGVHLNFGSRLPEMNQRADSKWQLNLAKSNLFK